MVRDSLDSRITKQEVSSTYIKETLARIEATVIDIRDRQDRYVTKETFTHRWEQVIDLENEMKKLEHDVKGVMWKLALLFGGISTAGFILDILY